MDGGEWVAGLLVTLAGLATIAMFAVLHFEGLSALHRWCFVSSSTPPRRGVVVAVLGVTVLHMVQIIGWGLLFWVAAQWPAAGVIDEEQSASLLDAIYVSGLNYSTLGLGGDLEPAGALRVLVAMESLVGLLMITWSASFTYFHLSRQLAEVRGVDSTD